MNENLVDYISIVGSGNINKKERNQMVFDLIVDLERKKKQERPTDKIIDCCTKKLGLNRSQVDDAIKKLLDDNVIQSYTYNGNLCYKVTKNFQNSNTDSYIAHNETVAALNNALFKISLK